MLQVHYKYPRGRDLTGEGDEAQRPFNPQTLAKPLPRAFCHPGHGVVMVHQWCSTFRLSATTAKVPPAAPLLACLLFMDKLFLRQGRDLKGPLPAPPPNPRRSPMSVGGPAGMRTLRWGWGAGSGSCLSYLQCNLHSGWCQGLLLACTHLFPAFCLTLGWHFFCSRGFYGSPTPVDFN